MSRSKFCLATCNDISRQLKWTDYIHVVPCRLARIVAPFVIPLSFSIVTAALGITAKLVLVEDEHATLTTQYDLEASRLPAKTG